MGVFHTISGPAFYEHGWVPMPRYILRRHLILNYIKMFTPGYMLEIGMGIGALLQECSALGWHCTGVDTSVTAIDMVRRVSRGNSIEYRTDLPSAERKYDCILACEVLEHVEDDIATLAYWLNYLKPNGRLLLSVPAGSKRWSDRDVLAGHFRRYDRADLIRVFERAGFTIESLSNYGWPLVNIIDFLRAPFETRKLKNDVRSQKTRTEESGIYRNAEVKIFRMFSNTAGYLVFKICFFLQKITAETDWGNGYCVVARSSSE